MHLWIAYCLLEIDFPYVSLSAENLMADKVFSIYQFVVRLFKRKKKHFQRFILQIKHIQLALITAQFWMLEDAVDALRWFFQKLLSVLCRVWNSNLHFTGHDLTFFWWKFDGKASTRERNTFERKIRRRYCINVILYICSEKRKIKRRALFSYFQFFFWLKPSYSELVTYILHAS